MMTIQGRRLFFVAFVCVSFIFAAKHADSRSLQGDNGSFKKFFRNAKAEENEPSVAPKILELKTKQNGGVHGNGTATNRAITETLHVNDDGGLQLNRSLTYPGGEKVIIKLVGCEENKTNQEDQIDDNKEHQIHPLLMTHKQDLEETSLKNDHHDSGEYEEPPNTSDEYYYVEINQDSEGKGKTPIKAPIKELQLNTPDRESVVALLQLITASLADNSGLVKEKSKLVPMIPDPFPPLSDLQDNPAAQKKLHDLLIELLTIVGNKKQLPPVLLPTLQLPPKPTFSVSYEAQQLLKRLKEKYPALALVLNNVRTQPPKVPGVLLEEDQQSLTKLVKKYPLLGFLKKQGDSSTVLVEKLKQILSQRPRGVGIHRRIPPVAAQKTLEQIMEDEVETFKKVVKQNAKIPDQKQFNGILTTVATLLEPPQGETAIVTKPVPQITLIPQQAYQVGNGKPKKPNNHQSCPKIVQQTDPFGWIKDAMDIPLQNEPLVTPMYAAEKNPITDLLKTALNGITSVGSILNPANILKGLRSLISGNSDLQGLFKYPDGVNFVENPLSSSSSARKNDPNINKGCVEYVYNNYPDTRPLLQNVLEKNRYKRSPKIFKELQEGNDLMTSSTFLDQFGDLFSLKTPNSPIASMLLVHLPKFLEFARKSLDWFSDDKNIQEYKAYFFMPLIFGVVVGVVSGATMVGFKTLTETIKGGVLALDSNRL